MNLKLEIEFSKAPILQEVDALKKQIDDVRPLSPEIEGRVMQKLRLDWNYNSNAIEGNKLSYGETTALLMHGITAKGKPLKDHLDLKGHNEAIGYLDRIIKDGRPLTETDIRGLHEVILIESYDVKAQTSDGLPTTKTIQIGKYKSSDNHVETITGEIHYYTPFQEIPAKMGELMDWYYSMNQNTTIHPVVTAALLHFKFVAIHPFDDGNGRLARILMNLVLMQNGFPPVVVKKDDKQNYYALLSQADTGEYLPFVNYIGELLNNSLNIYIKAINGGDIDEVEDIDKEIALLQMQFSGGIIAKEKKTIESVKNVFFESILPLAIKLDIASRSFQEYFFLNQNWLRFNFSENRAVKSEIEYIGSEYQDKYVKILSEVIKELDIIKIELGYREYRNPENNFNLTITIAVVFERFYYKIFLNNELLTSKLYHEKISIEDQNKIIRSFVLDLKYQFAENQKSPKS
ncbi:Fic family protein [Mucilaginibacter dorajii]|uniref:Fido domain-containing protein n=1 Tax=Mucilaginibacter dorajii TaxID=692994 RepID=A0ABP7QJQ2_9SPHI|nr:Fic family protein [Mucilaginibacter dorajii]MCS3734131.1 Fic family protein [Mucilaginibacter dorajii]